MKKILLSILSVLLLIFLIAAGHADDDKTPFSYIIQDSEAIITGLAQTVFSDRCLTIPDSIEGYPVTEIAAEAFKNQQNIKSVVLPDSIRVIHNRAFSMCSNLTVINLPHGLQSIEEYAFSSSGLTEIIFPESLTYLGSGAFQSNNSLEKIFIPGSIKEIEAYVFSNCNSLKYAVIGEGVNTLSQGLFAYCRALEIVELPDSLCQIKYRPFDKCIQLKEIRLSSVHPVYRFQDDILIDKRNNTLVYMLESAATGEVFIPEGICIIGDDAFAHTNVTDIVFPESLRKIGNSAFIGCNSLKHVVVPGHVLNVGLRAFELCENLQEIIFEEGVQYIFDHTFERCSSLQRVYLPESLSYFGFEQDQPEHTVFVLAKDTYVQYELLNERHKLLSMFPGRIIMASDLPAGEDHISELQESTYGWRLTEEGAYLNWSIIPDDLSTVTLPTKIADFPVTGLLPWCVNSDSVEHLRIPDTVIRISDNALAGLPAIQSISCKIDIEQAMLGVNKPLSGIQMQTSGLFGEDLLSPAMPEGCIAVFWNGFDIPVPENWNTVYGNESSTVWEGPDGSRLTAKAGVCQGDEEKNSNNYFGFYSRPSYVYELSWDEILKELSLDGRIHTKEALYLNGTDAIYYTLNAVTPEAEETAGLIGSPDTKASIVETGLLLRHPIRRKPNVPNCFVDQLILETHGDELTMEILTAGIRPAVTIPEIGLTATQDGFLLPIPDGWIETAFSVEGGRHPDKTIRVWTDNIDAPETLLVAVTMNSEQGIDTVWGASNYETITKYYERILRYSTLFNPEKLLLFESKYLPSHESAVRFLCSYHSGQVLGLMYQHKDKLLTLYYARKNPRYMFTEQDIRNSFLDISYEDFIPEPINSEDPV